MGLSKSKTITINSPVKKRKRPGSQSIEVKTEPVVHVFDDDALGAGVAKAIRDEIEKQIQAITELAKPSTIRRRMYAKHAIESGSAPRSVLERYSGGGLGTRAPTTDFRLFNDSGRLAKGLAMRKDRIKGDYVTEAPANRLENETRHLVKQLFDLVPALRSPKDLMRSARVRAELEASVALIMVKSKTEAGAKRAQLKLARANAAKAALGFARSIVGL